MRSRTAEGTVWEQNIPRYGGLPYSLPWLSPGD